jgi:membrane protein YqaA with SNARE-associated domain
MTGVLDGFFQLILGFGLLGVFVLALLDSTFFIFLPFALDAVLIILISRHREWMPLYALAGLAGSLAGSALTYYLISKASEETIEKKLPKEKFERFRKKAKESGFAGILVTSLLPPPFPFTPFVMAAAVTHLPRKKMFAAISIGRFIRYFAEGVLALLIGRQLLRLFESNVFKAIMLGLFIFALLGTVLTILRWVRRS